MKGDIVSAAVVIVIIISSTILVLNTINPFIQQSKDFQSFNEAKQTLTVLDASINQLLFEAPGARRTVDLNVPAGKFIVAGADNQIKIRLDNVNLFTPGTSTQEGNILVTSGSQMKAYESDIDGDGNTDLVLDNGALIFAIKKLGTPSSNVVVNTSTMITLMQNKNLTLNITNPRSGIYVNDKDSSSYGVGYTELTRIGNTITDSSIHVFLNSTVAGISYDATFSLKASQDFITLRVNNVNGV